MRKPTFCLFTVWKNFLKFFHFVDGIKTSKLWEEKFRVFFSRVIDHLHTNPSDGELSLLYYKIIIYVIFHYCHQCLLFIILLLLQL